MATNCLFCGDSFNDRKKRRSHAKKEHGIPCSLCEKRDCIGDQGLADHTRDKHAGPPVAGIPCDQCGRTLKGEHGLRQHKEMKHGGSHLGSLGGAAWMGVLGLQNNIRQSLKAAAAPQVYNSMNVIGNSGSGVRKYAALSGFHGQSTHPYAFPGQSSVKLPPATPVSPTGKQSKESNPAESFLKKPDIDLNTFIVDHLQPTETFNTIMSEVINELATFLKGQQGLNISQIIKGGSMGKGTAIKEKADIDMVVFVNDYKTMAELIKGRAEMLERIGRALEGWKISKGEVEIDKATRTVLKISVTKDCKGERIVVPVDVLIGMNIPRDKLKALKWAPTSYPMELIVIDEWQKNGHRMERFEIAPAFKQIMKILLDSKSIRAIWNENYSYNDYFGKAKTLSDGPFLLDPANPYNNVADRFDWENVAKIAQECLSTPLVRNERAGWYSS